VSVRVYQVNGRMIEIGGKKPRGYRQRDWKEGSHLKLGPERGGESTEGAGFAVSISNWS